MYIEKYGLTKNMEVVRVEVMDSLMGSCDIESELEADGCHLAVSLRDYDLGCPKPDDAMDRLVQKEGINPNLSLSEIIVELQSRDYVIGLVYAFEHGEIYLSMKDYNDPFDSWCCGFIYYTPTELQTFQLKPIDAYKSLESVLKTLGFMLNGYVYYISVYSLVHPEVALFNDFAKHQWEWIDGTNFVGYGDEALREIEEEYEFDSLYDSLEEVTGEFKKRCQRTCFEIPMTQTLTQNVKVYAQDLEEAKRALAYASFKASPNLTFEDEE